MSTDYPLMMRLTGRRCVVVGGGAVAARKLASLLTVGAQVVVIAPQTVREIDDLEAHQMIRVDRRPFVPSDLVGAVLAFAATNSRAVNQDIAEVARAAGVIVNIADDPETCDFTVPAAVRHGDVTLAISTGGRSPAFSRFLREQLQEWLTGARCELLELAGELRIELREAGLTVAAERWQIALGDEAANEAVASGDREGARQRLRAILTAE